MIASVDPIALRGQRQQRLRAVMDAMDVPALLTPDPVNIGYACGHRNMTVYGLLGPSRFLLMIAGGPAIIYEFPGCEHLSAGLETISEVRPATTITANGGALFMENLERFAQEVASECRLHHPDDARLAVERVDWAFTDALRRGGMVLQDGTALLLEARRLKQPEELVAMREAVARVEQAVGSLEASLGDGATEVAVWAELHRHLIAREGEYIVTRLFQSGPNTFPYFREAGTRVMRTGDLVCLDTDATGYLGYSVDFSRTFLCGAERGTVDQRALYQAALEQLRSNAALLGPGLSYEEFARQAWPVPERFRPYGYYCLAHGLGLSGEHPNVPLAMAGRPYGFPGRFEENMVVCVESYIGDPMTAQGVKLEDQYLITASGAEKMTGYPMADQLA